jgi:hypothetical protein
MTRKEDREMPGKEQESDDDYHEEAPDWWLEKVGSGEQIISYNVRKEERPGGMKVRFKIGVVSGPRAKEIDARQAKAIMDVLEWVRQQRAQQDP